MTRAEWFAAATLLIATVGLLQTLGSLARGLHRLVPSP